MTQRIVHSIFAIILLSNAAPECRLVNAQEPVSQLPHGASGIGAPMTHDGKHLAEVNERGDEVMGFSHLKTKHHFGLAKDGGVIAVEANDRSDLSSVEQIRRHLAHIAVKFARGDFEAPMLIHRQVPPGVPVMQLLKAKINYNFERTDGGGRITISTSEPDALKAIHKFLRFQIEDHNTGDSIVHH